MNIHLENINLNSTSGPNHFASKLIQYMGQQGAQFDLGQRPDARLCFIETNVVHTQQIPLFQRLDGIYFNTEQPYELQNANIKRTYLSADGVIFQSEFNKALTTAYFGDHPNTTVIRNGADTEHIATIKTLSSARLDQYEKVWCCASSWRPHKRLQENIRYFLEHSAEKDCLIIAGEKTENIPRQKNIFYVGNLTIAELISVYKRADYFLHLAWLDHCPNVVVDARAAGCQIICSSAGGTQEIAGPEAIVIEEDKWDFQPVPLYHPPPLDFSRKIKNKWEIGYNMDSVAISYYNFLQKSI